MTLKGWLRGLTDRDTPLVRTVREALGVDLCDTDDAEFGILVVGAMRRDSLQQIQASADHARIIILLGPDLRLGPKQKWLLLSAGAADVLEWPGDGQLAAEIVPRIARWTEIEALLEDKQRHDELVGESPVWRDLLRQTLEIAAFSQADLLLTGETGTGKEQIARLVHAFDRRPRKADLVVVDCATLSRELMGSELFGHERGAFTGAVAGHDGAIALANRGTLFLDEIGELDPPLQAQLLRVIQERSFKRIGSNIWQQASFRLICATNRDLGREVCEGRFRADLYYRISDRVLHLPPLRERREDIPLLMTHFWRSADPSAPPPDFDPALRDFLVARDYPGNVRDLRRIVMALRIRHAGGAMVSIGSLPEYERPSPAMIEPDDPAIPSQGSDEPLADPRFLAAIKEAIERGACLKDIGRAASSAAIRIALEEEDGNLRRAAARLGVTDRALQMRRANGETFSS
jgi:transcriptional regulator with GAF, ATPase, and Fis domain